jgi:hypothetical protein
MLSRTLAVSILVGAAGAALAACASQKQTPMAAPASAAAPDANGMPPEPRAEIQRLANEIDTALRAAGQDLMPPAACAVDNTCTAAPMSVAPIADDPTCKPAQTETCTQSCTLATSICDNAGKICKLADQLGGADAYANETCVSATDSCKAARTRCCGCT